MYVINIVQIILYFILLFICAITDFKYGKIYNKNIIKFLIIYIFLFIIEYIVIIYNQKENLDLFYETLLNHACGFVIGFIICFILYILSVFKAGDAKLLSVVALVSGYKGILFNFSVIFMLSGLFALIVLIKNGILKERIYRVFLYFKGMFLTRKFDIYEPLYNDNIKFPLAVYILLGEIIVYLYYFINSLKQ